MGEVAGGQRGRVRAAGGGGSRGGGWQVCSVAVAPAACPRPCACRRAARRSVSVGRVRVSARGSGLRVRAPWESRDRCVGAGAERESGAGGAAPVGSPRVSAQRARVCAAMRVRTEPAPGPSGEPLPPAPAEEAAPGPPRHRPPPERLGWCWGGAGARSIPERLGGGPGGRTQAAPREALTGLCLTALPSCSVGEQEEGGPWASPSSPSLCGFREMVLG